MCALPRGFTKNRISETVVNYNIFSETDGGVGAQEGRKGKGVIRSV